MTSRRRLLLATRCAALALLTLPWTAWPQDNKPLEWVVGYAAGGGSDVVARVVGEQIAKILGRPVVINNKPGAATNIAADYVAKSKDFGNVALTADFATLAANPAAATPLAARLSSAAMTGLSAYLLQRGAQLAASVANSAEGITIVVTFNGIPANGSLVPTPEVVAHPGWVDA